MWRSRVRHTLDKTSCLIKHQNKPQQYRHFVLKQRLNLGNEWGLVCVGCLAWRDIIMDNKFAICFIENYWLAWPGEGRGWADNKQISCLIITDSICSRTSGANIWRCHGVVETTESRGESLLHTILNSDQDEANEPSPDCVLDSSSWWCNPGEDLCNISKDWDSLAWENVPQSFNSEIWEALKSEWLPLNCDSFK